MIFLSPSQWVRHVAVFEFGEPNEKRVDLMGRSEVAAVAASNMCTTITSIKWQIEKVLTSAFTVLCMTTFGVSSSQMQKQPIC